MFSGMFIAIALLKKGHAIVDEKLEPVMSGSLNPFLGTLISYNGLIARNILKACRDDRMDNGFLKNLTTAIEGVVKDRGENGGIAVIREYLLNGWLINE
ncbi:hypothetical protein HZ326_30335 [Fusarium oxysporum f. sp. albedinis]|nr:hypothetical protein HZ326_30335 [Fusarium oxysporum f. sp. albedinis]